MQKKAVVSFILFFTFFVITLISLSISSLAFAQSQIDNSVYNTKFNYYNPSIIGKIQYPSFWKKTEIPNNNTVYFISPLKSVWVSIQSIPTPNLSIDEITMNMIASIKSKFSNVHILNISISNSNDGSKIQTLKYSYSDGSNTFQVLQLMKIFADRTFIFKYYADSILYDRFFPLVQTMFDSFQIPKFTKFLSQDNNLNSSFKSNVNKQNNRTLVSGNFLTYNNKALGITIQYPPYLQKFEKDNGILLTSNNKSVGVILVNVPLNNISKNGFIKSHILSLNSTLHNFKIINASTSNLMGYPTQMILFSYSSGTHLYKGMQFWKIAINHVYIFTYYAQSTRIFENYLPIIIKMVDTLKVFA
jgi:hypothetical protein